jgi:N-acetylmuramoyl-L-alanine amidase
MTRSPLRIPAFHLLMVALLLVLPQVARAVGWETIRYNGNDYVTARSIKSFYNFDSMTRSGSKLILENKVIEMKLTVGGQEVWMNNVKFVFSFPIVRQGSRYLISRIDLSKMIDPVLRPRYIRPSQPIRTIIIDPGHGGKDSGTTNRYGYEKSYNLKVALKLKKLLESVRVGGSRHFKVILTRNGDQALTLSERVNLANQYSNALFISIHFNSGGRRGGSAEGIETFTLSPVGVAHYGRGLKRSDYQTRTGNSQDSSNIALATAIHSTALVMSGRPDRGIRRARYSVLTGVKHPAILLEGGFMSHSYEARLINNDKYQETLAKAIFEGIKKYKVATEKLPIGR